MTGLGVLSVFVLALFVPDGTCGPVRYDQRQEGETNVRADVQDVVFVVVPPKDLVSTGMGLLAASAASLLRKTGYGPGSGSGVLGMGPYGAWSRVRPYAHLDKTPFTIDLAKSGFHTKKIHHYGDPNRYNFHETKNPVKSALPSAEADVMPEAQGEHGTVAPVDMATSTESVFANDNKTVKKDLKPDEVKMPQKETTKDKDKGKEKEKDKNKGKESEKETALEKWEKGRPKEGEAPRVIGEFTDGLGPDSIFSHEGCGPEAYRDKNGVCVYKPQV